jgi:hypothetical protein
MVLVEVTHHTPSDGQVRIYQIQANGNVSGGDWWEATRLHNFTGNIPPSVMDALPADAGHKAQVFYQSKDPIIALRLTKPLKWKKPWGKEGFYAAVWKWD